MTTADDRDEELNYSAEPHHARVQYKSVATVAEHVTALDALHKADKAGERRKSLFGWLMAGAFILTFAFFFGAMVTQAVVAFVAAGISFVGILALGVLRGLAGASDVDDPKLHAVRHPLSVLAPEIKEARKVAVWIDFGSYEKTKPVFNDTGFFNSSGQKIYKKPEWLRLRFSLLDGTAVRVTASTTVKRKQKAKRKYVKIKDKVTDELTVQLKAPPGRTLRAEDANQLAARFKAQTGIHVTGCRIKPRVCEMRFRAGPGVRVRGRYGWQQNGLEKLLTGFKVLDALIYAYNATAVAASDKAA
jgi:hypothetical protein